MISELMQYVVLAVAVLTVYCPVVLVCMLGEWALKKYEVIPKNNKINGFIVGNILFVFIAPMFLNINM